MSAIGGIGICAGRSLNSEALNRMMQALRWMGPDQQHSCADQHAGLVQCTLSTSPMQHMITGPLCCPQTGCLVAADCRFDNRAALIARLNIHQPEKTLSDLQLLLAAYHRWGEQTPQYLLGDFAFAIWDPRHRHFFCARDHMGVRPLYYLHHQNLFAFASHPAALLELPGIDNRPNEQHIACFLLHLIPEETDTFYRAIRRLPPGHQLTINADTLHSHQYWSPLHVQTVNRGNFQDNAEQFRDLFIEAVRCRTLDAPLIASTLSGGLDSSSITCVTNQLLKQKKTCQLHTFSAIFPSIPAPMLSSIDERRYIDIVQQHCSPVAHHVRADQLHPFITLDQDLACVGQPFFGPNMYIHNALFESSAQAGATIFLDGTDGDSVLSYGFELFPALLCSGHWGTLLSEVTALKKVSKSRQSLSRLFASYTVKPLVETGKNLLMRFRSHQDRTHRERLSLLRTEFRQRNNINDLLHRHYQRLHLPTIDASAHHRASLAQPFLPHILEVQSFFSARHALSIRFPFLDKRLVEFCLALPPEHKFHQGWSRAIQRQAMVDIVPQPILQRLSKADLSPNFFIGLQGHGKRLLHEKVIRAKPIIDEYLQIEQLSHEYDQIFRSGSCTLDRALFLYAIANVSTWLSCRDNRPEALGT